MRALALKYSTFTISILRWKLMRALALKYYFVKNPLIVNENRIGLKCFQDNLEVNNTFYFK